MPSVPHGPPEPKGARRDPPLRVSEDGQLPTPIWDCASRGARADFGRFKPRGLWPFVTAAPARWTHSWGEGLRHRAQGTAVTRQQGGSCGRTQAGRSASFPPNQPQPSRRTPNPHSPTTSSRTSFQRMWLPVSCSKVTVIRLLLLNTPYTPTPCSNATKLSPYTTQMTSLFLGPTNSCWLCFTFCLYLSIFQTFPMKIGNVS